MFLVRLFLSCFLASQLCANAFNTQYSTILIPINLEHLKNIVFDAAKNNKKIALKGAGKSQGGQTAAPNAATIDMSLFNNVVSFSPKEKIITVQAGMTWKQLQEYINPYGLAVKAMQSYCSFSIGGSLSVNVHGQDINWPALSNTVRAFTLLKADGSVVTVTKAEQPNLFKAVIGGYGLCGIILDVTLELTDNIALKRKVKILNTKDYPAYFDQHIKNNPEVALHSTRLSISPLTLFNKVLAITYYKTETSSTSLYQLQTYNKTKRDTLVFDLLKSSKLAKVSRMTLELVTERPITISRNNAMHATIDGLINKDPKQLYILQEYFVPCTKLNNFLHCLKYIVFNNKINLLNGTIRYLSPTPDSMLSYAPQERFAVVLYISVEDTGIHYTHVKEWTQKLISRSIALGGTYYLPYHLCATKEQVQKAYPNWKQFVAYKKQIDPKEIFVNNLYLAYAQ